VESAQTHPEVCARTNSVVCAQCSVEIEGEASRCFWCTGNLCWLCWEKGTGQCIQCARMISGINPAAQMAKMRRQRKGGRPRVLRRCPVCKSYLSAREMRTHRRECRHGERKAEIA